MTFSKVERTLNDLHSTGIVAVVRARSADKALGAIEVLVDNGITGIEVTFTTPDAHRVIADCVNRWGPDALIGAGTITTAGQVTQAVDAGASFLVSPGTDEPITTAMVNTGLVAMSGALTPSEVMLADRLGVHVIKVFPGSLVGPSYLSALRGPFPNLRFMPTGGVSAENLVQWFGQGAFAVGAGGDLVPGASVDRGDFDEIARRARLFVDAWKQLRTEES